MSMEYEQFYIKKNNPKLELFQIFRITIINI